MKKGSFLGAFKKLWYYFGSLLITQMVLAHPSSDSRTNLL